MAVSAADTDLRVLLRSDLPIWRWREQEGELRPEVLAAWREYRHSVWEIRQAHIIIDALERLKEDLCQRRTKFC